MNKPEEGIVAAAAEVHNEEFSPNHAGAIDAHYEGKRRGRYKKWQGTDDENTLLVWCEKNQPSSIDYDEIAKILGRSACKPMLYEIHGNHKEKQTNPSNDRGDQGLSHVKNSTSGQLIPEELDIKNLLSNNRVFKSFDEALNNNKYGYHPTMRLSLISRTST